MPQPPRYTLDELLTMIAEPNRSICKRLITDHTKRFNTAPASSHIHQNWRGGYRDHLVEAMNLAVLFYRDLESLGRFAFLPPEQRFTLSHALVALFWHAIEKMWRYKLNLEGEEGELVYNPDGSFATNPNLATQEQRTAFAARIIEDYGVELTDAMKNALVGIRNKKSPMWPLAVLCHTAKLWSALGFREYPLQRGDPWGGACRSAR